MAVAGSALIKRRLKQRFGIASRKMAIRSELPWYVRGALWIAALSVSLALAAWLYDAGRRFAGFDRAETEREIADQRKRIEELWAEVEKLRPVASASDSRRQLERTTQEQLIVQLRSLQQENAGLKEDLAMFEGLVSGSASTHAAGVGLRVARVGVEPVGQGGRYRFRALVVNAVAARNPKDIRQATGSLQFELVFRQGDKDVSISVPRQGDIAARNFEFSVRHFQRLEGEFQLPAGAALKSGEVRLIQDSVVKYRQPIKV